MNAVALLSPHRDSAASAARQAAQSSCQLWWRSWCLPRQGQVRLWPAPVGGSHSARVATDELVIEFGVDGLRLQVLPSVWSSQGIAGRNWSTAQACWPSGLLGVMNSRSVTGSATIVRQRALVGGSAAAACDVSEGTKHRILHDTSVGGACPIGDGPFLIGYVHRSSRPQAASELTQSKWPACPRSALPWPGSASPARSRSCRPFHGTRRSSRSCRSWIRGRTRSSSTRSRCRRSSGPRWRSRSGTRGRGRRYRRRGTGGRHRADRAARNGSRFPAHSGDRCMRPWRRHSSATITRGAAVRRRHPADRHQHVLRTPRRLCHRAALTYTRAPSDVSGGSGTDPPEPQGAMTGVVCASGAACRPTPVGPVRGGARGAHRRGGDRDAAA